MLRKLFVGLLVLVGFLFISAVSEAENNDDCLCIASETVQKYCRQDKQETPKTEYRINQEIIAKRDIQKQINHSLNADFAKDAVAKAHIETDDFTIKELDGKVYTKESSKSIGASADDYQGILRVSEDTYINIECLTLKGKEAIVYTNQHFVRYVPDRKDGSPHEVITNIIHRETWIFTEQGWKIRYIEELERGNTYLDGKLFDIS